MRLHVAILACTRDNDLIRWHLGMLERWGIRDNRFLYYGEDQQPLDCGVPVEVLPIEDRYENLPVKVYSAMKRALERNDWDFLAKTDVNGEITRIDWGRIAAAELAGHVNFPCDGVSTVHGGTHATKVSRAAYAEPYTGPVPLHWVSGPAYFASRRLVQAVVARGIWYARSHVFEDVMVSLVAQENGIVPADAVEYISDEDRMREDADWRAELIGTTS